MGINENGYATCKVDLNERQTKVIYNLLFLNNLIFPNEFVSGHNSQMNLIDRKINEFYPNILVDKFFMSEAGTPKFSSLSSDDKLNTLRRVADKYLLELEQFSWIDVNSTRLCYFVFLWVKGFTVTTVNNQNFNMALPNFTNIYCTLAINQSPNGNKEMKRAIQDFFDLYLIDLTSKCQLISQVKHAWNLAGTYNYFGWVDKNNAIQCQWILEQIKAWSGLSWPGPYRLDAEPVSDKYSAFIAMTDIWNVPTDQKELHSRRMQDAWKEFNKKTNRVTKNTNRATQVNIGLSGELEIKFEYLKAHRNTTNNADVLRRLIEEEYDRLHNSKQGILPLDSKL